MSLNSQCPLFLSTINPSDYLRLNSAGNNIEGVPSAIQSFSMSPSVTNGEYSGITSSGIIGETIAFGDALYLKSDGKYWKADASASTTMPCTAIALGAGSAGSVINLLVIGFICDDSWAWTVGGMLYPSTTAGEITDDISAYTTGDQVQCIGYAYSANTAYINPSYVLVEVT